MTPALRGHLAMFAFSAMIAGSFSLGSRIANTVAPEAVTVARLVLAIAVIGAAVAATGGVSRSAFRAPWRYLVLGGLFATYFILMFEGLKTAPPVSAAAVFTLTPLLSAGFGWLLLRQVTTPRMALALGLGAVGALWVIFRADLEPHQRGEAIYFAGCICHAAYTPMVRKLNRGEGAMVFSLGMMIAATGLSALWGWPAITATPWLALSAETWAILVYLAVFASAITFVLVQYAALRLPSAKVMAYTYLAPSWVMLWEFALGHGSPPARVAGGVALTAVALILLLRDEPAARG